MEIGYNNTPAFDKQKKNKNDGPVILGILSIVVVCIALLLLIRMFDRVGGPSVNDNNQVQNSDKSLSLDEKMEMLRSLKNPETESKSRKYTVEDRYKILKDQSSRKKSASRLTSEQKVLLLEELSAEK